MNFEERALAFPCQGAWLYGILSMPAETASRGVLIVVGGPQYRAGSHRQFTLLARQLASEGIPAMRFDYRGMGDSQGAIQNFEDIGDDISAAIDQFMAAVPGLKEVAIWGLCDAASAAAFYAHRDERVCGLALLNPWVRTGEGAARAYLKHYYLKRVFDPGLWQKIARGRFACKAAGHSLLAMLRTALQSRQRPDTTDQAPAVHASSSAMPLPEKMYEGLNRFNGRILLVLSGDDMTAQEFSDLIATSRQWRKLLRDRKIRRHRLAGANHTFSQQEWREQVATWTRDWLRSW
ncbi:hydrolase 1, exosortase A system-associated [Noviherbaspirillum sedimenti]|uniref:Hydrolase 1, exosortase A system-associated n=2 Tax=Noviherbaspirillum sedimenti TaxID=2320865 RepID=A0A3A3G091_9BURK|nr:hydrolase 1, exosortase A system-associated [Noviherbaspirillum sedimenti]